MQANQTYIYVKCWEDQPSFTNDMISEAPCFFNLNTVCVIPTTTLKSSWPSFAFTQHRALL